MGSNTNWTVEENKLFERALVTHDKDTPDRILHVESEGVGIKGTLPAYRDPKLQPSDLLTGVCFASGGSGLDYITGYMQNVLTSSDQVNMFKEYISKLKTQVGETSANSIISKAFYLISFGNNDIGYTYYAAHARPQFEISTYTSTLVYMASKLVKELYGLGARRIGFMSALPLGCLPGARGGSLSCNEIVNEAAQMFNSKLSSELASLQTSLSQSNIVYLDVYNPLLDVVRNPQKYGFTTANVGCVVGVVSCPVASSYVFWDYAHPTEKTYRIIVNQTLAKYSTIFS
ncbi:hypothetical protein OROGR_014346 [Orobanche gracilis]